MPQLTPEQLSALLERLTEVETEARMLRAQIEQRLLEQRRALAQVRNGQPQSKPPKKRKSR